jgi:hypothetical protein
MASRPPENEATDAEARTRWMVITMLRFMGFGLAVLGLLMSQNAVVIAGDVNRLVGYIFIVLGLVDGFVVPQVMARKWRTPDR